MDLGPVTSATRLCKHEMWLWAHRKVQITADRHVLGWRADGPVPKLLKLLKLTGTVAQTDALNLRATTCNLRSSAHCQQLWPSGIPGDPMHAPRGGV